MPIAGLSLFAMDLFGQLAGLDGVGDRPHQSAGHVAIGNRTGPGDRPRGSRNCNPVRTEHDLGTRSRGRKGRVILSGSANEPYKARSGALDRRSCDDHPSLAGGADAPEAHLEKPVPNRNSFS